MLDELQEQCFRLDRPPSWIVQRCVKQAMSEIRKLPSATEPDDEGSGKPGSGPS